MKETLKLPAGRDGDVWLFRAPTEARWMHRHDELELNLVTRGTGRYLMRDRRVDLREGTLIWLFPEQEHVLADQSRDLQMWIVVFRPELVARVLAGVPRADAPEWSVLGEGAPGLYCRELLRPQAQALSSLYQLVASQSAQLTMFNTGLSYVLASSWGALLKSQAIARGADLHPAVERIAQAIHNDPAAENLEDLAGACGLSYSRLSRLFKAQTGVSLVQYRRRQRIENFFALYRGGQRRTLTEAAMEAGFGSYPAFHRDFTRVVGMSPAAYRRSLRGTA